MKLLNLLIFTLFVVGCSTSKKIPTTELETLETKVLGSSVFNNGGFTGFVLFDPEKEIFIENINGDKYFTPASNTKILTYFTAKQILGDSIAALKYVVRGDSLIFAGTGDPSFLNSIFSKNDKVLSFLKNRTERLFFTSSNFKDGRYGKGWMWDDYPYSFQPEKSPFPIYGNVVAFKKENGSSDVEIIPVDFQQKTTQHSSGSSVKREEKSNQFLINKNAMTRLPYERKVPFIYSDSLFVKLLATQIEKPVALLEDYDLQVTDWQKIYTTHTDSLYQKLMQDSDNFIAEQLLLACSDKINNEMNTAKLIQYAKDSIMKDMVEKPLWVDGSGVSRYNKMKPEMAIHFLHEIYKTTAFSTIKNIFPTGGVNGTIENWYPGEPPYVFAKTGSLSGVHNLSGYVETKSGKRLIFSFMHNNYTIPLSNLKKEMQVVLEWIRDGY